VLAAVVLFVSYRLIVLTQREGILWFVSPRQAVLSINRKSADGWLHREWSHRWILVTVNSLGKRESYLVWLASDPTKAHVQDCGEWTAPHVPLFPFPVLSSDILLCLGWSPANIEKMKLRNHKVRLGSDSAEFSDVDGNVVYASWK
jgi:hypothetical protein